MTPENDKGTPPENDQQQPTPKQTDEGQPIISDAEVTLPDEEGGEATITEQDGDGTQQPDGDGQQQAQPEKRGKNRVPAKQRINQLWREKTTAETRAQELERENAELKTRMAAADTKTAEVNAAAMTAHESSWKNAAALARRELIDAKNAANPEAEANAIAKLSRAESELANIEAWRASQPKPKANGAAQPEAPQPPRQDGNGQVQPQQVEVSPEIQDWVERNLWAVNDPRNPEFDPEMANYMAIEAKRIELKFQRQGRAAEIGTAPYFELLDTAMREEFPDRFDDTEEPLPDPKPQPQPRQAPANQRRAPQMQRQNGTIAPAGQSAGQQTQRAQPRSVNLSAEERQFAHQMAANGALKYPVGHKMQGKQMAPADAEIAYARQKLNQSAGR